MITGKSWEQLSGPNATISLIMEITSVIFSTATYDNLRAKQVVGIFTPTVSSVVTNKFVFI
jgi:hypothetical protein